MFIVGFQKSSFPALILTPLLTLFAGSVTIFVKVIFTAEYAEVAEFFYSLTPLIEVYHTLCDSVRSVRDNNNQKSSSEEDLSPSLSSRYLRDLMVIPKSLAALCFDPWAVSIAFRI